MSPVAFKRLFPFSMLIRTYIEDRVQICKPQYLAYGHGRIYQPQTGTSRLKRYQCAYSRRVDCSNAAEVHSDVSTMATNGRAKESGFSTVNESAITAHSHFAPRIFNRYVQQMCSPRHKRLPISQRAD